MVLGEKGLAGGSKKGLRCFSCLVSLEGVREDVIY